MTTPRDWIRKQRDRAQRDYDDALNRLNTWTAALALTEETQPESGGNEPVAQEKTEPMTIGDYVKQVLEESGPQRYSDIARRISHKGREVAANSINVHLNRYKGKRYYKTDDGKWHLRKKNERSTTQLAQPSTGE